MSLFRGPGRSRAFLRFVVAVVWTIAAYVLSERAALTFSQGAAFPLIRDLFALLLFVVGYSYMAMAWDRARNPLKAIGLVVRRSTPREFGMGAALGWGMVAVFFLIVVFAGHFYIRLSSSPGLWGKLVLQLAILAVGALAAEAAFRGYPFQKLIETTGPLAATVLAALFFGILEVESPAAIPAAAAWINAVAAATLSLAYLRTRALWFCWGLHFSWLATIGVLFGQPLAGDRGTSSIIQTFADGPTWLTGSEYGPEGSVVALAILWAGLLLLFLMTRNLSRKYNPHDAQFVGAFGGYGSPVPSPAEASQTPQFRAVPANLLQPDRVGSSSAPATDPASTTIEPISQQAHGPGIIEPGLAPEAPAAPDGTSASAQSPSGNASEPRAASGGQASSAETTEESASSASTEPANPTAGQ